MAKAEWTRKRPHKHPWKEWDFKPNKHQVIHGALLDLGKAIGRDQERIAQFIAEQWGEEI